MLLFLLFSTFILCYTVISRQSATIDELRSVLRALEQEKEQQKVQEQQQQQQHNRTPSLIVLAPPLDEAQHSSNKRARGDETFPTSLPHSSAQINSPTPLGGTDENAGQLVSFAEPLASSTTKAITDTCPFCNEKPFGLMVSFLLKRLIITMLLILCNVMKLYRHRFGAVHVTAATTPRVLGDVAETSPSAEPTFAVLVLVRHFTKGI
jgi:hypothetical protein